MHPHHAHVHETRRRRRRAPTNESKAPAQATGGERNNAISTKTAPSPPRLVFKNMPARSVLSSAYQYLVDIPVMQSAGVMTGALLAIALAFWAAYWILAAADFSRGGAHVSTADATAGVDAACLLWYSVSTTTTLGDAPCTPEGGRGLFLANIHAMVVQLALVYVTGVVFTRMSKPGLHLTISKILLVDFDDENFGRCLKTRLFFDAPGTQLIDVSFNLSYTRRMTPTFLKTSLLSLTRAEAPLLRIGTEITHPVASTDNVNAGTFSGQEESPLVGETMETLKEKGARFTLTVLGTEEATMQTCFFSQTFTMQDGIIDGHAFKLKDMGEATSGGGRAINFANLHEVVRIGESGEPVAFAAAPYIVQGSRGRSSAKH
jgi:hypothetical protein